MGQRVHAHRGHADDLVERLGIDGAQGHELVGHGAAEDLGAAEGGAGNTGKYVGYDDGGDVGVHFVGEHHRKVHEVLETGAGIDDGRKAHQRGGQQQGIDAGGKACNQVLNNVALEILIIGNN